MTPGHAGSAFIRVLLPVLALAGLSCSKSRDSSEGKTTITFWHSFVSSTVPAFDTLVAAFEQEHPGIRISAQYVPTGDALVQKLITAVQSATAPDVSWIHSDFLQQLVEADAIYPIAELSRGSDSLSTGDLADFFPPLLRDARWKGTLYCLPMEATSLALLYNKEIFRTAGLDPDHPPATWAELRAMAERLTTAESENRSDARVGFVVPAFPASGPLGGWMVWQWYPFLFQAGGSVISADQSRVEFNNDAGVQALAFWKTLYNDLRLRSFTVDYEVAFASKQLAMTLDGPWNIPRWKQITGLDWAVAPLPAGPAKRATIIAGEDLAVFRQSKHPREAWEFIRWMIRPDVQALWSMKSGYLPVRRSVMTIPPYRRFLDDHPALKVYVDQLAEAESPGTIDYHSIEITRYLAGALEEALVGNADPRVALDEAAAKCNALLQQVKR